MKLFAPGSTTDCWKLGSFPDSQPLTQHIQMHWGCVSLWFKASLKEKMSLNLFS